MRGKMFLVVYCPQCEVTKDVLEAPLLDYEGTVMGEEVWFVGRDCISLGYCECGHPLIGEVHKEG